MTFGEKLTKLRKENNVTQEQLANTLGVSRQSISKWESDLAYPETDKLIRIGELFGCSLDYLLKKSIDQKESGSLPKVLDSIPEDNGRTVTMEEVLDFLAIKKKNTFPTAIATFLCIISPICLLLLGALSERKDSGLSENITGGLGLIVLLILVGIAAVIFIMTGRYSEKYEFLERETIRTSPEAVRLIREEKENFRATYTKGNAIGTLLCILSLIPLILGRILWKNSGFMTAVSLCIMLVIIGLGVMCFIMVGIPWESFQKLLQQGEYSPEKKANARVYGWIAAVYWLAATAGYLSWSFVTNDWGRSWILWPIAGVVFPALLIILRAFRERNESGK